MDPNQTAILLSCIGVLVLALMLRARESFNRARVRNTMSIDVNCDADGARETIRQLTAETERLNQQLLAARRNVESVRQATAQAHRDAGGYKVKMMPLPVKTASEPKRTGQQPPRQSPPTPAPAKKKAAGKR